MGKRYLKKKVEETIDVMGAKIELKALSYEKQRLAVDVAMKFDMKTQQVDMKPTLLATLRALYQIKSWDLTDENDKPLPITLKTLDEELDPDFVNELVRVIGEVGKPTVDAHEKK